MRKLRGSIGWTPTAAVRRGRAPWRSRRDEEYAVGPPFQEALP